MGKVSEDTYWVRTTLLTWVCVAVLFTMVGAGCANSPIQDQLLFCDAAKPLRPAPGETANLSEGLVGQIHEQNAIGAEACGWEP